MQQPQMLKLNDAFKQYRHDQEKVIAPEETVRRFQERLAQSRLKILDDVVRIDNGRLNIPVYFSICGPDARAVIGNYKQMGKGATPGQAQASAVMELGERFSLFSFRLNPANFHFAPAGALHYPRMTFQEIARSVEDHSDDAAQAADFLNQLPMQWTWAHNLSAGRTLLVPWTWFWSINEFNGSCAGNCNEEAICQGISEVVERHVSALISRTRNQVPLIAIDSIQDPAALELIGKFRAAGIELFLSDFSMGMGIPSVGALGYDPTTFPQRSEMVWTAGTMPSAAKALCRALTEVAQLAGDFNSGGNYVASGLPKFKTIAEAGFVTQPGRTIGLNQLPDLSHANIRKEIENCVGALARQQMEVHVVDVRHPQLDIPAFYTIVPGAHFRERAVHASVGMISAKIVAEQFDADQALKGLTSLSTRLPDRYYIEFYRGQVHLNQGRHEQAVAHLRRAADSGAPEEDLASIYTYLGLGCKERGRYRDALDALERADRIDAERTDTLNLMGFCHYKLAEYEAAISCFKRIISLNPSSAIDYANLASNYRALGERDKAIENYQLALALDDGIEFAREHLRQLGIGR